MAAPCHQGAAGGADPVECHGAFSPDALDELIVVGDSGEVFRGDGVNSSQLLQEHGDCPRSL